MTTTLNAHNAPRFPMTRAEQCPFDPPPELRRLQQEAPIARVTLLDGSTPWLVTRYADQRAVLADPRVSSDVGRPGYPSGMPRAGQDGGRSPISFILMDDPEHARLRRMVTGAFAIKRVAAMRPAIQRIVDDLIDAMLDGPKPVDLVEAFALPVPSLVICELLGVPYEDRDSFQRDSAQFMVRDQTLEEKIAAYTGLTSYLGRLVTARRAEPGDDILSDLARDEDLSIEELVGMAFLLLLAGHETTANMLALGAFALLEHPDQLAELRAGPDLMPGAVEELLRYLSVADIFYRYAAEDIELGGETIAKGSTVVVSFLAANRDPRRFEHPDALDVRREARGHLAFGHGVHQCLGQQLARIEMRAGFAGLLRRFPDLRLAVPANEVRLRTDMNIYGVHELPVTWGDEAR